MITADVSQKKSWYEAAGSLSFSCPAEPRTRNALVFGNASPHGSRDLEPRRKVNVAPARVARKPPAPASHAGRRSRGTGGAGGMGTQRSGSGRSVVRRRTRPPSPQARAYPLLSQSRFLSTKGLKWGSPSPRPPSRGLGSAIGKACGGNQARSTVLA